MRVNKEQKRLGVGRYQDIAKALTTNFGQKKLRLEESFKRQAFRDGHGVFGVVRIQISEDPAPEL